MKVSDIIEGLKKGEITLDFCGHEVREDTREDIIERYEDNISKANGSHDGKWGSIERGDDANEVNKRMREFYQVRLDAEVKENKHCYGLSDIAKTHCFCCGEDIYPTLSGNTLKLNCIFHKNDDPDINRRYVYLINSGCPLKYGAPLGGVINITEKMVLANFIPTKKEDCPDDENRYDGYSLNSYLGRKNITEWKAKAQNVAYGQTGSCGSTNIYINKAKDHVLVTETRFDDNDEEVLPIGDFECIGKTEVAVWRFEATDTGTTDMTECEKVWKEMHHDYVIADVKPGKWEFITYYDKDQALLAELKLIKG